MNFSNSPVLFGANNEYQVWIRRAENAARRGPSHPQIRVPEVPQQ